MRRGTTPTLTFIVPFNTSTISALYITFKQNNYQFDKALSDCTLTTNTVAVTLSQTETLGFNSVDNVHIQLRVKYTSSNAVDASQIISIPVGEILKGGEI